MSDTTQLFILAGAWSVVALYVARAPSAWIAKIFLYSLLVGIPFWELPYGYYNFRNLCDTEVGPHIYERISPQKMICANYPFDSAAKELLKYGFETIEAKGKNGEVARFEKSHPDKESTQNSKNLQSKYCISYVNNIQQPWRTLRHDFTISKSFDGAVVGRFSVFDWEGTWWQAPLAPVLGRGGTCRQDPIAPLANALRFGAPQHN